MSVSSSSRNKTFVPRIAFSSASSCSASSLVIRPASTDAWINGHHVVSGGLRLEFDDATVRAALSADVVDLEVSLGVGDGAATAYGCDLTQGYVDENAAYYSS